MKLTPSQIAAVSRHFKTEVEVDENNRFTKQDNTSLGYVAEDEWEGWLVDVTGDKDELIFDLVQPVLTASIASIANEEALLPLPDSVQQVVLDRIGRVHADCIQAIFSFRDMDFRITRSDPTKKFNLEIIK
jgi:hypothetical protein